MNRVRRRRYLYVVLLIALALAVAPIYWFFGWVGLLAAGLLLLAPGRIGGHYLRDLFRSRRLIDDDQPKEAIDIAGRFLEQMRREPWKRRFVYCFFGVYTWDVDAMARNNIGAALIRLGELDRAEAELRQAIALDAGYPIPYVNLAVICQARGAEGEAARLLSVAKGMGYTGGSIDALVTRVGGAYARMQG